MKSLFTFTAGLLFAISASALNIESGKNYRIVCTSNPTGTLCTGENHGSSAYLYHNPYYDGTCKDAYWTFKLQSDGSYTIVNADTQEYITYSSNRINGVAKGLILSSYEDGDASHWFIEEIGDGVCLLYTQDSEAEANNNPYWNLRNGDGTFLLGTYAYSTDTNALFSFIAQDGEGGGGETGGGETGGGETGGDGNQNYTVVDGGSEYYVLRQTGNRLTVIPKEYVKSAVADENDKNTLTLTLFNDKTLEFSQCESILADDLPADAEIPSFTSYKFNNKFNYQVPVDAEATDPTASEMTIPVGGIGKWLTASFKLSDDNAVAYIGETLQKSKETRQRFDNPMTYTVTYPTWKQMEIRYFEKSDDYEVAYRHYGRQQTVNVEWLCDNPTTQYGVPRIDITLTDYPDKSWGSSGNDPWGGWGGGGWGGGGGGTTTTGVWIGMNGKSTYENASITIDGAGVYPDMETTPIQIKGRGNSTWSDSYQAKNPYHFKFETALKPLGLTKGKHWVLLCNKQSGSMTTNAIGHRVADMMGVVAPCHIIPVELYVQGSYRGSYNLCERIGFGNNCVDIDDETNAAMVELDTYTDESIYRDDYFYLCTKMKDPDFDYDYDGVLSPEMVMSDWENMVEKVYAAYSKWGEDDDFTPYLDVEKAASFLAASEYITNCELKHAKSVFAYTENINDGFDIEANGDLTPWILGPLWDCDWAFGYEQQHTYFKVNQTADYFTTSMIGGGDSNGSAYKFWSTIRKNEKIDEAYYKIWSKFINQQLPELIDFCNEYYAFAKNSFTHNKSSEASDTDSSTNYATTTSSCASWLEARAKSIFSKLTPYTLPVDPVDPDPVYGDPESPAVIDSSLTTGSVGIDAIIADDATTTATDGKTYDLLGRRVVSGSQGILVRDGKKNMK